MPLSIAANGRIEFDEFILLMTEHMKEHKDEERELIAAFQVSSLSNISACIFGNSIQWLKYC